MVRTLIVIRIRGGQVLVSRTVRDLVAESHLVFEEQGTYTLKGLRESMPLFTAMNERRA
jgi:class 3 adenylate cyclase